MPALLFSCQDVGFPALRVVLKTKLLGLSQLSQQTDPWFNGFGPRSSGYKNVLLVPFELASAEGEGQKRLLQRVGLEHCYLFAQSHKGWYGNYSM